MTPVPESPPKPASRNSEAVRAAISARLFGQDVFISYASPDKSWAEAIHHLLTSHGYRVFWDDQGVHSGDEFEKILEEVRRSTCLVVLVSASFSKSAWVPREIQAHLKRPRKRWRLIPVFLDDVSPSNMPVGSEALAAFHGIRMSGLAAAPAEAMNSAPLLAELIEQFRALRTATIRKLVFASVAVVAGTAVAGLLWKNRTDTQLNELLRRADVSRANSAFQDTELDLAKAWRIRHQPSILQAYRVAQARRVWQNGTQIRIATQETVLAIGAVSDEPYVVLHNTQSDALSLMFKGQRLAIQDKCGVAPLVELRDALLVWACGADLGSLIVGGSQERRRLIRLPAEPAKIQMRGEKLMVLFHDGPAAQVGTFLAPELKPAALDLLKGAREGGEIGFCPAESEGLAWQVNAPDGAIAVRTWQAPDREAALTTVRPPSPAGGDAALQASWISRVRVAPDCGRFFVEYAPFTLARNSGAEMVDSGWTPGVRLIASTVI